MGFHFSHITWPWFLWSGARSVHWELARERAILQKFPSRESSAAHMALHLITGKGCKFLNSCNLEIFIIFSFSNMHTWRENVIMVFGWLNELLWNGELTSKHFSSSGGCESKNQATGSSGVPWGLTSWFTDGTISLQPHWEEGACSFPGLFHEDSILRTESLPKTPPLNAIILGVAHIQTKAIANIHSALKIISTQCFMYFPTHKILKISDRHYTVFIRVWKTIKPT